MTPFGTMSLGELIDAIALVWGCASPDDFPAAVARRIGTPLTRGIAAGG